MAAGSLSNAERQRRRRAKLREQGIVDVTVPVPKARAAALRRYARGLCDGAPADLSPGRLLAVIRALKAARPELEAAGVRHAGVFGSTARGEDAPGSDVDVVVDLDPARVVDFAGLIRLSARIEAAVEKALPGVAVEVADHAALKPRIRDAVDRDAVYAF